MYTSPILTSRLLRDSEAASAPGGEAGSAPLVATALCAHSRTNPTRRQGARQVEWRVRKARRRPLPERPLLPSPTRALLLCSASVRESAQSTQGAPEESAVEVEDKWMHDGHYFGVNHARPGGWAHVRTNDTATASLRHRHSEPTRGQRAFDYFQERALHGRAQLRRQARPRQRNTAACCLAHAP